MRFYNIVEYPLRVYLEEESTGEMAMLLVSINTKYAPPENDYSDDDELDSIIFCDELGRQYIVRGLVNIVLREAQLLGIQCKNETSCDDSTLEYPDIDKNILDGIELRNYQTAGISASLAYRRGIVQVHTGGGKTEMMIGVTRYLLDHTDMNILLCVPSTKLLYQTFDRMKARGIPEDMIALLGDGNKIDDMSKRVLISTVQSAYKRLDAYEDYMNWLSKVDCLMMDEAHHSKCRTWSTLIDRVAPTYMLGFTAEPFHRDKDHIVSDLVLRGLLGPIIHRVTIDYLVEHGYLSKPYVLAVDTKFAGSMYKVIDWTPVNKSCIVNNKLRNEMIRDIAVMLVSIKKNPLLLVQQIAHGQELSKMISLQGCSVYMMTGGQTVTVFSNGEVIDKYRDDNDIVTKEFNEGKIDVLIGTSTLDEGVDIPSLSSVILAGGGKGRLKNIQRIGRALRSKPGANTSYIIDFRDRFNVITASHFKRRKASYDDMSIPVYLCDTTEDMSNLISQIEERRKAELGLA